MDGGGVLKLVLPADPAVHVEHPAELLRAGLRAAAPAVVPESLLAAIAATVRWQTPVAVIIGLLLLVPNHPNQD